MTMQNEPQLSAEMKKRFNEALKGIVYVRKYKSTYKYSQDDDGIEIDLTEEVNGLKHFLATALEEQRAEERAKAIGEVEAHYQEMSCTLFDPDYLEGVRASIEIMKGKS